MVEFQADGQLMVYDGHSYLKSYNRALPNQHPLENSLIEPGTSRNILVRPWPSQSIIT